MDGHMQPRDAANRAASRKQVLSETVHLNLMIGYLAGPCQLLGRSGRQHIDPYTVPPASTVYSQPSIRTHPLYAGQPCTWP
jgi:hypothetical protein